MPDDDNQPTTQQPAAAETAQPDREPTPDFVRLRAVEERLDLIQKRLDGFLDAVSHTVTAKFDEVAAKIAADVKVKPVIEVANDDHATLIGALRSDVDSLARLMAQITKQVTRPPTAGAVATAAAQPPDPEDLRRRIAALELRLQHFPS